MSKISPNYIDLSLLLTNPAAAEILLLARGQLNRAFRARGLVPPDPLPLRNPSAVDPTVLDDPAALGIEQALAQFQEAFLTWTGRMPLLLAGPVLDILRQAHEAFAHENDDPDSAGTALLKAYEFLLERSELDST